MTTFSERLQAHCIRTPEQAAIHLQQPGKAELLITYRQLSRGANAYVCTYGREGLRPASGALTTDAGISQPNLQSPVYK